MIAIGSREALIQNLEDAGYEPEMIRDFLSGLSDLPDTGKPVRQMLRSCLPREPGRKEGFLNRFSGLGTSCYS